MNQQKKFKIAIIVLSTLLVLSAGGLAAQLIVLKFDAPLGRLQSQCQIT